MRSLIRRYGSAVLVPAVVAAFICAGAVTIASKKSFRPDATGPQLLSVGPSSTATFTAKQGDSVTAEFTLTNCSDAPVKLLGTNTTCGCTVVDNRFPIELQPGQSTVVLVQMKVGQPTTSGKFTQEATVLVNRAGMVPAMVLDATVSGS